jgi:hypothetical protein
VIQELRAFKGLLGHQVLKVLQELLQQYQDLLVILEQPDHKVQLVLWVPKDLKVIQELREQPVPQVPQDHRVQQAPIQPCLVLKDQKAIQEPQELKDHKVLLELQAHKVLLEPLV